MQYNDIDIIARTPGIVKIVDDKNQKINIVATYIIT